MAVRFLMLGSLLGTLGAVLVAAPAQTDFRHKEDVQAAMNEEAYAAFLDARAADQARRAKSVDLAAFLEYLALRNSSRFQAHARWLSSAGADETVMQAVAVAVAQYGAYGRAADNARQVKDAETARHFDLLAAEAGKDLSTLVAKFAGSPMAVSATAPQDYAHAP
jgi:hypothetical protein